MRGLGLALVLLAGIAGADEVILLDGTVMKGTVVGETKTAFELEVIVGSATARTTVAKRRIHAVVRRGVRTIVNPKKGSPKKPPKKGPKKKPPKATPKTKTRAEVEAIIKRVGKEKPPWWDKVPLAYPRSLELGFGKPSGGWNNRVNIGQYVWDVVNPNAKKWKEGAKFLHFVRAKNKKDGNAGAVKRATESLAGVYFNLLGDWARAVHFWRQIGRGESLWVADCYLKLGSPEMARELAERYSSDRTRHGQLIKLWSDLGEHDKALQLALRRASNGGEDVGYLAAGDIHRALGQFDKALDFYNKAAGANGSRSGRDHPRNVKRARAAARAIVLFDRLDIKKVRSGTYAAGHLGYNGDVNIEVTVRRGKIVDLHVTVHREKQYYSSLTDIPKQIIAKQSIRGIVPTTGATITADAILNATAKALSQGMPRKR